MPNEDRPVVTFQKVLEELFNHYMYFEQKINISHRYGNKMGIELTDAHGNTLTFMVDGNNVEPE